MSRFLLLAVVLAEINLRCVPTSACGDDDDECVEMMETETGEDADGEETDGGPMPDMGS